MAGLLLRVVVVLVLCNLVACSQFTNATQEEYIVIFNKYMDHEEHQHILQEALVGMESGWHIIRRNNPASMFPSDFALISVTGAGIVGHLKHLNFVKHVIPQRRIVNPLQGYEEGEDGEYPPLDYDEKLGGGVGEKGSGDWGEATIQNTTRNGRYHHWFPEPEAENLHLPGTRKLHSSVFQVTDMFNAHELWKKHSGSSVKVAIFDTGLRRGHPHFRNVMDITNWTDEDSTEDGLGHGTFVTGTSCD